MRAKYMVFCLLQAIFCLPLAAEAQKTQLAAVRDGSPVLRFIIRPYAEQQKGTPGYEAKLDFIETHSAVYPHAEEIGKYINAQLLDSVLNARQDSAVANLGDFCAATKRSADICTNELYMKVKSTTHISRLASIYYDFSYFPVGAAHPMRGVLTYNFSLKPVFRIDSLYSLFENDSTAFVKVQEQVRTALTVKRDRDGRPLLEKDMVWEGTKNWQDFGTFILTRTAITVIFPLMLLQPMLWRARGEPALCRFANADEALVPRGAGA